MKLKALFDKEEGFGVSSVERFFLFNSVVFMEFLFLPYLGQS
jgi:hypothetical protein